VPDPLCEAYHVAPQAVEKEGGKKEEGKDAHDFAGRRQRSHGGTSFKVADTDNWPNLPDYVITKS
jgi:hypothetical protein